MKVLALDYGAARTGVAVSDATGTIARPVGVVERAASDDGLAALAALVAEHDAERVIVGLPLTLRGERGAQAIETDAFVEALRAIVRVPVESRTTSASPPRSPRATAATPTRTRAQPPTCSRATCRV